MHILMTLAGSHQTLNESINAMNGQLVGQPVMIALQHIDFDTCSIPRVYLDKT